VRYRDSHSFPSHTYTGSELPSVRSKLIAIMIAMADIGVGPAQCFHCHDVHGENLRYVYRYMAHACWAGVVSIGSSAGKVANSCPEGFLVLIVLVGETPRAHTVTALEMTLQGRPILIDSRAIDRLLLESYLMTGSSLSSNVGGIQDHCIKVYIRYVSIGFIWAR